MAGRLIRRRELSSGIAAIATLKSGSGVHPDRELFALFDAMRTAESRLGEASSRLAEAEKRIFQLPRRKKRRAGVPAWYVVAKEAEEAAGAELEVVFRSIARTPARSHAGLAIKVRLLAAVYGEDPYADVVGDDESEDTVAVLIRSILADVVGQPGVEPLA